MKAWIAIACVVLSAPAARGQEAWLPPGDAARVSSLIAEQEDEVPTLAVDPAGTPWLAWIHHKSGSNGGFVYVRRLNPDGHWEGVNKSDEGDGIGSIGGFGLKQVCLALGPAGEAVVAWVARWSESRVVYLKRWVPGPDAKWDHYVWFDGGAKVSDGLDGISGEVWSITSLCLRLDPAGHPIVAWDDGDGAQASVIRVKRWSPSGGQGTWRTLGESGVVVGQRAAQPSIAVSPAGHLYLAWQEPPTMFPQQDKVGIYVFEWNVNGWYPVKWGVPEPVNDRPAAPSAPVVVVDADGIPVVAWCGLYEENKACVLAKRWNPGEKKWEAMGPSADLDAGGLSGPGSITADPAMASGPDGGIFVAWSESLDGSNGSPSEILARRWSGGEWVGVAGSDSGAGISATAKKSILPSVAFGPFGLRIAWQEQTGAIQIWCRARINNAPMLQAMRQYRSDGAAIADGGGILWDGRVLVEGDLDDPDGDLFRLEIQLLPEEEAFDDDGPVRGGDRPFGSEMRVTFEFDDHEQGRRYHWRGRCIDDWGRASGWSAGMGFFVRGEDAPPLSPAPDQYSGDSGHSIPLGGRVYTRGVEFSSILTDPEEDPMHLEVEIRLVGDPFRGEPTMSSGSVKSGAMARVQGVVPMGPLHWRARAIDAFGAGTPWVSFGGNGEDDADFILGAAGSLGNSMSDALPACGASAAGGPAAIAALALVALLRSRRPSGASGIL